jgi:two-component system NtrC family sensor kinase
MWEKQRKLLHDLKNSIMVLKEMSAVLARREDLSRESKRMAEILHANAIKASNLLALVKSPPGNTLPSMSLVDLKKIIKENMEAMSIVYNDVNVSCSFPNKEDVIIWGNEDEISRLLINLSCNAIQAMSGRGAIFYELRKKDENTVLLSIRDTGIGMDARTRERIFDSYFTTKVDSGGEGLGLSVVRDVAQKHGWEIEVKSAPRKGTEFIFRIPLAIKSSAATQTYKKRILLVDDYADLVETLSSAFDPNEYDVAVAKSAKEALELVHENEFHCVVSDNHMPGMNGIEMIREIRKKHPNICALMLVGDTNREILEAQREGLVSTALTKPCSLATIKAAINRALAKRLDQTLDESKDVVEKDYENMLCCPRLETNPGGFPQ